MSERIAHIQFGTVDAVLDHHAAHNGAHTAIRCGNATLSYVELFERAQALAAAMWADGVRCGDRVAYLGQESVDYYANLFACALGGYILVPVNFRLTTPEVAHIVADSDAALILVDDELVAVLDAAVGPDSTPSQAGRPHRRSTSAAAVDRWITHNRSPHWQRFRTVPETPVVMLYTSGTTGLPKGVVLAHRSFFAIRDLIAAANLDWFGFYPDDVSLIGIPGLHVGGLWWSMQGFSAGITNVALPRWDSAAAVAAIEAHAVTHMCVVPAMLRQLLAEPALLASPPTSIRAVIYGGSPISESILERALALLRCDFGQIYGLTETGNTAFFLPPDEHRPGGPRMRAAGRPYPGVDVQIVDDTGQPLAPGTIGEVLVRTPAAMLEYWRRPEASAETLVDGWIHTGDGGYLDADGFLFICDRIKDMVIVGGENVYPAEVENAIVAHPSVSDAAVVGIADEVMGERVVAYVAPLAGESPTARELFEHCRHRLAPFKIPTRFHLVDVIPRNPSGKILRRLLTEPDANRTDT